VYPQSGDFHNFSFLGRTNTFLRGHAQKSGSSVAEFQAELMRSVRRIDDTTARFGIDVLELIKGETAKSRRQMQGIVNHVLRSEWAPSETSRLNALDPPARNERVRRAAKARNRRHAEWIINTLKFETIDDRKDAIPKAFRDTFEWLFRTPPSRQDGTPFWSDFTTWLKADSKQIYWITGKAGAGKSTLIKFLAQDRRLGGLLDEWAADSTLLLGSYYSWNAGNNLQKSHEGLLRTLLHQCLSGNPELLVPLVFPGRWALTQLFGGQARLPEWRLEDLMAGFRRLVGAAGRVLSDTGATVKMAVVVDGLDEFEGQFAELVELLQEANANPNVKICASSRPWNVFKDRLRRNPMLQLEELTYRDIELYVHGKFNMSDGFAELQARDAGEAARLLQTVVEKAQGVFLWVAVVVRDLLEHLQEGDRLCDLQATLDSLPEDLFKLFQFIWNRINSRHHGEASQYFQIVETCEQFDLTPYAVSLWLGDGDVSLDLDLIDMTNKFMSDATTAMARRIDSRTKGLLELYDTAHVRASRVDYMHRTAREWVKENWLIINAQSKKDFQPHLWILKGETLRMAVENFVVPHFQPLSFWSHLGKLLDLAKAVPDSPSNAEMLVQILDRLDARVTELCQRRLRGPDGSSTLLMDSTGRDTDSLRHWCDGVPPTNHVCSARVSDEQSVSFLGLTAQMAISSYVKLKVSQDPACLATSAPTAPILMNLVFGAFPDDPIYRNLGCSRLKDAERLSLVKFVMKRVGLAETTETFTSVCRQIQPAGTGLSTEDETFLVEVKRILLKHLAANKAAPIQAWTATKPVKAPKRWNVAGVTVDSNIWFVNPDLKLSMEPLRQPARAGPGRLAQIIYSLFCIRDA